MRFAFLFLISFVVLFDIQAEELLEPVCIEIEQKGENASVAKKEALEIALKFALKDAIADQLNCSEKLVDGISKKMAVGYLHIQHMLSFPSRGAGGKEKQTPQRRNPTWHNLDFDFCLLTNRQQI